jgi:RimJ/RimL family protein N-acetyltransferase
MPTPTIPIIETERLILRGTTPADADTWVTFLADPDFVRYVPRSKVTRTPQERAERIMNAYQRRWESQPLSSMGWAATRKEDGQLIGLCGIELLNGTNDGELDYYYGKPYWGQGYATEAARAVMRYSFEHTSWDRVVAAIILPANIASGRVLDHLGLVYERHLNYFELTGRIRLSWMIPSSPSMRFGAIGTSQVTPSTVSPAPPKAEAGCSSTYESRGTPKDPSMLPLWRFVQPPRAHASP